MSASRGRRHSGRHSNPPDTSPRGFEVKSAPPDFNVACSSRRMRGNSWVGTWNNTALANTPSKWPLGNFNARKFCSSTSQPLFVRALWRTKPKDLVAAGVTRVERTVGRGRSSRHRGRPGARRRQRGLEHGLPPGLLVDRPPRARRPPGTGARAGNRRRKSRPVLHRSRVPLLGLVGDRDGRRPGRGDGSRSRSRRGRAR